MSKTKIDFTELSKGRFGYVVKTNGEIEQVTPTNGFYIGKQTL